jgi:molybdate transport system ATP-binding protein
MALSVTVRATAPIPLDVAFDVGAGELLALVGPSGAGKTTLLRAIAGLWRPGEGRVEVNGATWLDTAARIDLPTHRRRLGIVVQNFALFPHMSALANVMAAMDAPCRAEAGRLLDLVGLPGLGERRPAELSGGQQQRVALARALARRPEVLLLDEPFSAVDRPTRERLQVEILALRAHLPMPVVLVTHDINEAQLLADSMVVLEGGRAVASGSTATVMANPEALRALGIREAASLLPATLVAHLPDGLSQFETAGGALFLPAVDAAPGSRMQVRIMAHDVILSRGRPEGLSAQNILAGTVARITLGEGPGTMVYVAVGDHELLARITRRAAGQMMLAPGDGVHLILKSLSVARDHVGRADHAGEHGSMAGVVPE